jgi:hypothetical protein
VHLRFLPNYFFVSLDKMVNDELKIAIYRKDDNKPIILLNEQYLQMASAILNILDRGSELSLKDLIVQINQELLGKFKGEINWYLLNVKCNLEAQGLIQTSFKENRIPTLKINQSAYRKSKFVDYRNFFMKMEEACNYYFHKEKS